MLITVLVQVAVILVVSRLMGLLFARMRQPQVIGEILAGILLGPTLFGIVAPGWSAALFPANSMSSLKLIADIGVVVFLFLVGLEFDRKLLKKQGGAAISISLAGIAFPMILGIGLAYVLRSKFDPAHQDNFLPSALFMGAAVSVTAFPVLARILTERNLLRTRVGALSISAAAIDDVLAWTLLAVVVALTPSGGTEEKHPALIFGEALAYIGVMLLLVRPLLSKLEVLQQRQGKISREVLGILLLVMIASVYATEHIGVHALFGAFVAGFVMPKSTKFVEEVRLKLEDFILVFFLPLFFAFAGLKADLTRIFSVDLIGYTLLIIFVACAGKLGGVFIAAKLLGNSVRESAAVGLLMNTRGLMELIILTVGLSLGVINQDIYGMMVVMALVTTAMTAPLLALVYPTGIPTRHEASAESDKRYNILIPVARPESGVRLLEMAAYLAIDKVRGRIQALHLQRPTDHASHLDLSAELPPAQAAVLEPLVDEAKRRDLPVETIGYFSRDAASDVGRVARLQESDLVLIGYHTPVFGRALLGGTVHRILTSADADVAVYIDRELANPPKKLLVPFMGSSHDRLSLDLAGRIARSTGASITLLHIRRPGNNQPPAPDLSRTFDDPKLQAQLTVATVEDASPSYAVLSRVPGHDLVIIGVSDEWGLESSLLGLRAERIASNCPVSLLIVRRYQLAAPSTVSGVTPALAPAT